MRCGGGRASAGPLGCALAGMRAIEARLRRSRARVRHDPRDEAILRSLLDLRLRIDLFRQALRGVESLHARGNSPPGHQSREHLPEGAGGPGRGASSSTWGWPPTRSSRPRTSTRSDSGPAVRTSPRRSASGWASYSSRQLFVRVAPGQLASRIPVYRGDQLDYESPDYSPEADAVRGGVRRAAARSTSRDSAPSRYLCEVDGHT